MWLKPIHHLGSLAAVGGLLLWAGWETGSWAAAAQAAWPAVVPVILIWAADLLGPMTDVMMSRWVSAPSAPELVRWVGWLMLAALLLAGGMRLQA